MFRICFMSLAFVISCSLIGCGGSSATKPTVDSTPTPSIDKEGKAATKEGERGRQAIVGGGFKQGE